jgi:hypothetical protein
LSSIYASIKALENRRGQSGVGIFEGGPKGEGNSFGILTFSCCFSGLSLRFLASPVPLPAVALMIPIFYDRLIDNFSTNQAPPAKEGAI